MLLDSMQTLAVLRVLLRIVKRCSGVVLSMFRKGLAKCPRVAKDINDVSCTAIG